MWSNWRRFARNTSWHWTMFSVGLLLFAAALRAEDSKTIHIVSDFYPPFFQQPDTAQPGYVVELLQQIAASQGWQIDYQITSGARFLRSIQDGSLQCAGEMVTEPRAELRYSQQVFGRDRLMFFVRPESTWQFDGSVNSLQKIHLGVISGYVYPEPLASFAAMTSNAARVHWVQDAEPQMINLRKLNLKRLDAIVESETSLHALAQQHGIAVKNAGVLGPTFWLRIACLRQHVHSEQWIAAFDEGLMKIRQNGHLHSILARYGVSDWQPR